MSKECFSRHSIGLCARFVLLFLLAPFALATPAFAERPPVSSTLLGGYAVDGYDAVAYFTLGRAVKGQRVYSYRYRGATWLFSSAAHRDRFVKDPERYAPQFGGYCAWAVAQGYTASSDGRAWRIVGGKLYLNYSLSVRERWARDIPGNIERAKKNWPGVLTK